MKQINLYIVICLALGLMSCNDDAIFEKEMYKKVFALVSSNDYNIFEETHELNGGESIGYIAASCGGTATTSEDIDITLEEDSTPLDIYNKAIYDADESRYAKLLSKDQYQIDSYHIKIAAGERGGKTMIKVRPEGLSPDSIYFVALKVSSYSSYEVNEAKSNVLYRVLIKNDYASQATESMYTMSGYFNGVVTGGNKKMQPLGWNKVRIMAGTVSYQADVTTINRAAIVLEVTSDNRVRITPFKDIYVKAINDDPDYPNTFKTETINNRTYNVFSLCYEYILSGTTHRMKEELRMEIK